MTCLLKVTYHEPAMSAIGTFRTSSKLQAFDSLNQFRPLIFHIAYSSRYRVPDKLAGGHCSVGCYLFSFLPAYILPQLFSCCFRRQNQQPAVVNIDQPLIGRSGDNQKAFGFVSAFKWCASDSGHKDGLTVFPVDEGKAVSCFLHASIQTSHRQSRSPGHVAREV